MTHDERHFSNPDVFIPERWIESERGMETCNKEAFITFSSGKWNCVGKSYVSGWNCVDFRLALMGMRVILTKLIWEYDVSLKEGQDVPDYDHKCFMAGQLEVHLKKVQRN